MIMSQVLTCEEVRIRPLRAFTLDILKFLQILKQKTTFFYFTYSLLKYTLHYILYFSNTL
jgi:hypothetical protein